MSYRGVVHDTQSPPQLSCGSGDQASYVHSDQLRAARRDENSEGPLSPTEIPRVPRQDVLHVGHREVSDTRSCVTLELNRSIATLPMLVLATTRAARNTSGACE